MMDNLARESTPVEYKKKKIEYKKKKKKKNDSGEVKKETLKLQGQGFSKDLPNTIMDFPVETSFIGIPGSRIGPLPLWGRWGTILGGE